MAFGSRGWARTRVEDIAQSAGVSAATAYNHFPTKHSLLGQVFAPIVNPLVVAARTDIAAHRPVLAALEEQVRALCGLCGRNRTLTAAYFAAVSEYTIKVGALPDPGDDSDPRILAPVPLALELLIECGQRDGTLRAYPIAREISGLIVDAVLARNVDRPAEDPDTTAELLLSVMFGTLRPDLLVGVERPYQVGD